MQFHLEKCRAESGVRSIAIIQLIQIKKADIQSVSEQRTSATLGFILIASAEINDFFINMQCAPNRPPIQTSAPSPNPSTHAAVSHTPINGTEHKGFSLKVIDAGKRTIDLITAKFDHAIGDFLRIFGVLTSVQRSRSMATASTYTQTAQLQLFSHARLKAMTEVRERNPAIFQEELGLSGARFSVAMKRINPVHDAQYSDDFNFAYGNIFQPEKEADHAASLWAAHAAAMPLCESPLADYAWPYAAAMETLSTEIVESIEQLTGMKSPAKIASPADNALDPYAPEPPVQ